MIELPSWVATAADVFFYVFVVPGLAAYAIFCIALLVSPALSAIFGGVPLRERIEHGLLFCLLVAIMALHAL